MKTIIFTYSKMEIGIYAARLMIQIPDVQFFVSRLDCVIPGVQVTTGPFIQ